MESEAAIREMTGTMSFNFIDTKKVGVCDSMLYSFNINAMSDQSPGNAVIVIVHCAVCKYNKPFSVQFSQKKLRVLLLLLLYFE